VPNVCFGISRMGCGSSHRVNLNEFLGLQAGAAHTFHFASGDLLVRLQDLFHSPLLSELVGFQMRPILVTWIGVILAVWRLRGRSSQEVMYALYPLIIAVLLILLAAMPDGVDPASPAGNATPRNAGRSRLVGGRKAHKRKILDSL
jgi:hypothetical protein